MVSSITACFLEISDDKVHKKAQEETWKSIRVEEYPETEKAIMSSVFIWLSVILLSTFRL